MSRLPRALARRVDRLARRAHRFHRFAHHPLCRRYSGEVVRLGREARVCRGCALALAGVVIGAAAGAVVPAPRSTALVLAAGLVIALAVPRAFARRRGAGRAPKGLTRLVPTAAAAMVVVAGLRGRSWAGAVAAALAGGAALAAIVAYRRRGPDRRACEGCPDGPASMTCPGLAPVALRERAFRRLAGRWIAEAARESAEGRAPSPGANGRAVEEAFVCRDAACPHREL